MLIHITKTTSQTNKKIGKDFGNVSSHYKKHIKTTKEKKICKALANANPHYENTYQTNKKSCKAILGCSFATELAAINFSLYLL